MAQWLCHSFAMIMVSFTWCVLCTSMTIMALRIRKITVKLNAQMLQQIEIDAESMEWGSATAQRQRHEVRQVVKVRTKQVKRMEYITKVIVFVAVLLFLYTCYKYFFYSADCQPLNYLPIQVNSLFDLIGLGTDFIFWLFPVIVFFWPTQLNGHEERTFRRAKRRWKKLSVRLFGAGRGLVSAISNKKKKDKDGKINSSSSDEDANGSESQTASDESSESSSDDQRGYGSRAISGGANQNGDSSSDSDSNQQRQPRKRSK